ncbi:tripartite tricarboxylate transporter permease [Maritimibacter alkaliphilus]|uniref:tripartite tricarboxylate transporter permease n=1 Tax=Maritimibacter alkaliphilus TaxID=404236 RepID=UPI001C9582F6|nr:tripartite tricarboxylate transporter permease [Maritimibacter alkaliphilus]MBY6092583.1 tripartite tricarboxylate transporter permease [Maritimibacter alkaliphilus]
MDALSNLMMGFGDILTPYNIAIIFAAGLIGTVVGALPGLGPSAGIALMLPLTFGMPEASGLCLLTGVYMGTMYGGRITSILINAPGDAPAIITALEGYPMMQQGRGAMALGISAFSSFIGGLFGLLVLIFAAPVIASYAIFLGPPEYFLLMATGLATVMLLAGDQIAKAFLVTCLGVLVSTFGSDYVSGQIRFAFMPELIEGIDFVAIIIGLYGLGEVFYNLEKRVKLNLGKPGFRMKEFIPGKAELGEAAAPTLRGSVLGTLIGIVPGAGATVATFLDYALEKRLSKKPETFGTGNIAGLAGPEATNNAAVPGSLIPLITLGIPGSGGTAIMLGALIMFGLRPGPLLMTTSGDIVWAMIAGLVLANLFLLASNVLLIPVFVNLLRAVQGNLANVVIALCVVGAFSLAYSPFNIWIMLIFGVLGYLMKKNDYPTGPFILAVVLAPLAENYFRQSIMLGQGSAGIFLDRPISLTILIVMVLIVVLSILSQIRKKRRMRRAAVDGE